MEYLNTTAQQIPLEEYNFYNKSIKLYNDKVTVSTFKPVKSLYKWFSEDYKMKKSTGTLFPWTWEDALRGERSFCSSLRRTHRTLRELSLKNPFKWMLTIGFNKQYVDRKSAVEVHKKFKNIMKRLKYHFEEIAYISVPEFHKDQSGIHYHLMINFLRKPKTRYMGLTSKGFGKWIFHENETFKRNDCSLTLSKLNKGNNIEYLIKYLTKGGEYPLYRKYSATRGLKRSRVLDRVNVHASDFTSIKIAEKCGFSCSIKTPRGASYVYAPTSPDTSALARSDLSNVYIKDENLEEVFYNIIAKVLEEEQKVKETAEFSRAIEDRDYKVLRYIPDKRRKKNRVVRGQQSFDIPKPQYNDIIQILEPTFDTVQDCTALKGDNFQLGDTIQSLNELAWLNSLPKRFDDILD